MASPANSSSLSLILFDEIEKASPVVMRLLLGVLDKATLRLGDNNQVNFERTMIFMTSNLGAHQMRDELRGRMGFRPASRTILARSRRKQLDRIAKAPRAATFRRSSSTGSTPSSTYYPLDEHALTAILDHQLAQVQKLINLRLGTQGFQLLVSDKARQLSAEARHQSGIWCARTEAHHSPAPAPADCRAGGDRRSPMRSSVSGRRQVACCAMSHATERILGVFS